ncbi:hypothetical protein BGZ72_001060 [Mortierella alpina]|nr:hypothetical protein BGZ72_001060 [Mortierella alpina]
MEAPESSGDMEVDVAQVHEHDDLLDFDEEAEVANHGSTTIPSFLAADSFPPQITQPSSTSPLYSAASRSSTTGAWAMSSSGATSRSSQEVPRSILPSIQPQPSPTNIQVSGPPLVGLPANGSTSISAPSSFISTGTPSKSRDKKTASSDRSQIRSTHTPAPSAVSQHQFATDEEGSMDDELDDAQVEPIERQGSFWSSEGTEAVVDWISHPENYRRLNNPRPVAGSRVQDIHQEIADWIKAERNVDLGAKQIKSKIGYIKRKYREALALSSTGVGENVRQRQEGQCPPFERLHAVFNSSPSLHPPDCRSSEDRPVRSAAIDLSDVEELDHYDIARPQGPLLDFSESIDRLREFLRDQTQAYSDMMIKREAAFNNMLAERDREARASLDEELERKRRRVDAEITVDRERARNEISGERLRFRTEISEERQRFRIEIAEERLRLRAEIAEDRRRLRIELAEERQLDIYRRGLEAAEKRSRKR